MKKFPFEQYRLLVTNSFCTPENIFSQTRYFQATNAFVQDTKLLLNSKLNSVEGAIWRNYSSFRTKLKNHPTNSKIRTNECEEKVVEPFVATNSSPITRPPFSMDLTMNHEDTFNKLGTEFITSPSRSQVMRSTIRKSSKTKFFKLNTLTKYLRMSGRCPEVFKGPETNEAKCTNTYKECAPQVQDPCKTKAPKKQNNCTNTYKECAPQDPCKTKAPKPQKQVPKSKNIFKSLMSMMKSKKQIKPSGFLNEDLILEALNRLRNIRSFNIPMTCVKNTSIREKSKEVVFGVQNSCRFYSSGNSLLENHTYKVSFLVERCLLKTLRNEKSGFKALEGMNKVIKPNKIEETTERVLEGEEKDGIKPKNTRIRKKNNSRVRRRRRRPRWFSKIPIEPNVKGSVIFANGTAQVLDDPCKILSVNFSESNLLPEESTNEVKPDEVQCETVVQHLIHDYDQVVDKLKNEGACKIDHQKEMRTFVYQKPKDTKKINQVNCDEAVEMFKKRMEPMLRQKKVSKLDNTVKCFTTAVLPQKRSKKRQKRTSKRSTSDLKQGSADNLNTSLDINSYPSTLSSEAFGKGYHAATTNSLPLKKEGNHEDHRRNVGGVRSDNSFVKIKDIGPMFESGDEKEPLDSFPMDLLEKHHNLLPGVTRPVTQKAAHLNLLQYSVLTPVSNAWKKHPAYSVKMRDKGEKKKSMGINKPDIMEVKGVNYQQCRMKSTEKMTPSKCNVEKKPCHHHKKNNGKTDESVPLEWDYDARVPDAIAKKWFYHDCSKGKNEECPITNDDVKYGYPPRNPPTASAINRCNFEECKQRIKCRCKNTRSTNKTDK